MMRLTSTAFEPGTDIPTRFTCDGQDVSPPLSLQDIPAATVSLVLIMDDPDAPGGTWDHWVAYDIPLTTEIPQGVRDLGTAGLNSWGRTGYGGPCPPRGVHRYVTHRLRPGHEAGPASWSRQAQRPEGHRGPRPGRGAPHGPLPEVRPLSSILPPDDRPAACGRPRP